MKTRFSFGLWHTEIFAKPKVGGRLPASQYFCQRETLRNIRENTVSSSPLGPVDPRGWPHPPVASSPRPTRKTTADIAKKVIDTTTPSSAYARRRVIINARIFRLLLTRLRTRSIRRPYVWYRLVFIEVCLFVGRFCRTNRVVDSCRFICSTTVKCV